MFCKTLRDLVFRIFNIQYTCVGSESGNQKNKTVKKLQRWTECYKKKQFDFGDFGDILFKQANILKLKMLNGKLLHFKRTLVIR